MSDNLSEIVERYTAGLLEAELPFNWNVRAEVVPEEVRVIVECDHISTETRQRLFRVHLAIVMERPEWDIDFVAMRRDEGEV